MSKNLILINRFKAKKYSGPGNAQAGVKFPSFHLAFNFQKLKVSALYEFF